MKLAEDVLVKERELKKLREEKHTMKSQLEQQANFYVRVPPSGLIHASMHSSNALNYRKPDYN